MPLLSLPGFLPFGLQPCHVFALHLGLPSSWLATLQPLALVASPKLRLQQFGLFEKLTSFADIVFLVSHFDATPFYAICH
jgi:hypothetical protein